MSDQAATHTVICNLMGGEYVTVHFIELDCRTSVGPWFVYDTRLDAEAKLFAWGRPLGFDEYCEHWATFGRSTVRLELPVSSYLRLQAATVGRPWNGYELCEMKRAGTYPPRRLTPAEEARILNRRR